MNPNPRRTRRPHLRSLAIASVVLLPIGALASCGNDDDTSSSTTTSAPAVDDGSDATDSTISVDGAWARTSPSMASRGAAYMVITNSGDTDDALVAASVDASIAAKTELHESRAAEGGAMGSEGGMETTVPDGSTTEAPMMEMVQVERIDVPAGESVDLAPGGYHVMLIDLAAPLAAGAEVPITLTFEKAGDIVVTAVVGDAAP